MKAGLTVLYFDVLVEINVSYIRKPLQWEQEKENMEETFANPHTFEIT